MKKIMLSVLIISTVCLIAKPQEISIKAKEVELVFNNVKIKNIEFSNGNNIIVDSKKLNNIDIKKKKNQVTFSSDYNNKIALTLPDSKTYTFQMDDAVCRFDSGKVNIKTDDGEVIKFEDGNLLVLDDDGKTKVEINAEGIFVEDGDEKVEISSEGIIVDSDDENKEYTGFWGQLLGGFIKVVAKGSISLVGKSPEKIVKYIINDDDNDICFSLGIDDDDDGENITREIFKTYEGKADTKINIINKKGAVKVIGWEKDFVDIYAELSTRKEIDEFDKIEISVKEKKKQCFIETIEKSKNPKVFVEYVIKVPENMLLSSIQTSNGSIKIENVKGDAELSTSNGSIKVFNTEGNLILRTSNGSITADKISGSINAGTSNGSINVYKIDGTIDASTSNGSIKAEISFLNDDAEFSTSNGSIKLYLNPELNADILASTSNSGIKLNDIEITTSDFSKNYLKGKIGKGGKQIRAKTSNSSINIYELD